MLNVLLVNNHCVVEVLPFTEAFFGLSAQPDFFVADPYEQFKLGDDITGERYAEVYPDFVNPFSPGALENSVFCPLPDSRLVDFVAAGLRLNPHPHLASPYAYCSTDTRQAIAALTAYAAHHKTVELDFALMDKSQADGRFAAAGFTTLVTRPLHSREDLVSFPCDTAILKPVIGSGTYSKGHVLDSALYAVRPKEELLSMLDSLGAFADGAALLDAPVVIQQVADGVEGRYAALILSGGISGQGRVWHFAPIALDTTFADGARTAKTVWSPDNLTDKVRQLQQKVETLVAGAKNCFYQLQFLQCNGEWVPHDFQFRMTYYADRGVKSVGYSDYKLSLLQFVFDRTDATPAQPCSFGLSLNTPKNAATQMQFVSGTDKADVLTKLAAL